MHFPVFRNQSQFEKSNFFILFFQAKAEPGAAAPSAGLLKLQHAQPASSALANTVRIEKLSDEEDEEIDITDDLCTAEDGAHKPPVDDECESKGLERIQIQTENPKVEQNNIGLSMSLDHLNHTCSEETDVREQVSSNEHLQTTALTPSEQKTQEDEYGSFQSESSRQLGQLEEGGSDGTGKTTVVVADNCTVISCEDALFNPKVLLIRLI